MRTTKGNDRTLFAILNRCVTVGGSKYLRSCLLQPSANVNLIEERLDLVQEFVLNQAVSTVLYFAVYHKIVLRCSIEFEVY